MAPRKIRKHKGLIINSTELIKTKDKFKLQKDKEDLKKSEQSFPLTEVDRLTKIYKVNKAGEISEITCISLDIKVNNKWITIVYYDNFHNIILHKHIRVSLQNTSDAPNTIGVPKKGTQRKQLTWAIKDIIANYSSYKEKFFKRSKLSFKDTVDIQYR